MTFLQALTHRDVFEAYLKLQGTSHVWHSPTQVEFEEEENLWTVDFLSDGRFTSLRRGVVPEMQLWG